MTEAIDDLSLGSREDSRYCGWRRYLSVAALGFATALACLVGMFAVLAQTSHLPPPPISNNLCIDEKLAFMRDHPAGNVSTLIVGSSVAWRHIDSGILAASRPGMVPYNGAFCGLRLSETIPVAHWLLGRLPGVRQVVLVASPQDFEVCAGRPPETTFDLAEADRFVFQRAWRWEFYFRYFDPLSLARNVASIAELRTKPRMLESLIMTKYGDAPIDPANSPGLVYDGIDRLDPACFQQLRELALDMRAEGIALTVVDTPLNPLWEEKYDAGGRIVSALKRGIEAALAGSGAKHWSGDTEFGEGPDAFVDAIHLRWPAAQRFTKRLAESGLAESTASR